MLSMFKKLAIPRKLLMILSAVILGSLTMPAVAGQVTAPTSIESLDSAVIYAQPVAKAHTLKLSGGDLLSAPDFVLCLEHGSHLVDPAAKYRDNAMTLDAGSMLDARLSFAIPIGAGSGS